MRHAAPPLHHRSPHPPTAGPRLHADSRHFPQPWPRHVLLAWGLATSLFAVVFATWCWRYYVLGRGQRQPPALRGQQVSGSDRRKTQ